MLAGFQFILRIVTVFTVSTWLPLGPFSRSTQALAAEKCSSILLSSHIETSKFPKEKIQATIQAPAVALWERVSYMEVPQYMSHPLYKDIERQLPVIQTGAVQKLLYATSNGARKSYNFLSTQGIGLPFPAIKTELQRQQEAHNTNLPSSFEKTYWSDLKVWSDKIPGSEKMSRWSQKTLKAIAYSAIALFAVHTTGNIAQLAQTEPVLVPEDMSISKIMPLKNNQIQLLNETTPFPHMAIRIGNTVFSHGVQYLTQNPVDIYLKHHLFRQQEAPTAGSASSLNIFLKKTAILKRSVDSVTLNLTEEIILDLRNQLMQEVGKPYKNETFVNSCSSMVVRLLKQQGVVIQDTFLDASPSLIFSRLSLEGAAGRKNQQGQNLIAGIYNLQFGSDVSTNSFRNFLIRELEGAVQLQVHTLPIRLSQRLINDMENPRLEDLYIDTEQREEAMKEILAQADRDLTMIQEYQLYSLEKENLLSANSRASLHDLKQRYAQIFQSFIADYNVKLKDPGLSFEDYHLTQFKIQLLSQAIENE